MAAYWARYLSFPFAWLWADDQLALDRPHPLPPRHDPTRSQVCGTRFHVPRYKQPLGPYRLYWPQKLVGAGAEDSSPAMVFAANRRTLGTIAGI